MEQWAADTSAELRAHAPGYSPIFTRFSDAGDSPEQLGGYLDLRIEELRQIIQRLKT